MSYYRDLAEYIAALDAAGQLVRIKRPINKDTEMHPLVRWQFRGLKEDQRRAFLFENVADARGRRYDIPVLIGGLAGSQKIYALGLQCKEEEVESRWSETLKNPLEPRLAQNGPVKEVIHKGAGLLAHGGLEELPVPISTPGFDNAPYFTAGCWITKDPETGIRNMAVYRGQIKGPLKTGVSWGTLKNSAIHWEKQNRAGKPLEAALVIGGPPCLAYAAVQTVPFGVDELAIAGALAREPVELVKCETIDLEVPANADIVIEGIIPTDYLEPDGPFGESHGYEDPGDLTGVFEVTCITHRKNPVFVSMVSQVTPSESSKVKQSAYETLSRDHLKKILGDRVLQVALYEELMNRQMAVIQIKKEKLDEPWQAMEKLLQTRVGAKIMVCVDPDIDPYDLLSVNWAIANRSQPHRDMKIIPNRPLPWNPLRYVADGERYDSRDSCLMVDATLKASFPPVALPKKEYMERAKEIWEELGLPALTPRKPWHGYSLGYWPEDACVQAERATAGEYYKNGEQVAQKGVKVAAGERFMELKEKFLAEQLEAIKRQDREKK
jgi:4-hydroxy-3-polyprenylbenzoate decarboxylase